MLRANVILQNGLVSCAVLLAGACGDSGGENSTTTTALALSVTPLVASSSVGDAIWDLETVNSTGESLWQARLLSSQSGAGDGGIIYEGVCDPAHNPNTVTMKLVGLYEEPVDAAQAGAFGSDATSVGATALEGPAPSFSHSFDCPADTEVSVDFDYAQLVPFDVEDLGFFARAASVSGVACGVGVQCCSDAMAGSNCEPLKLLTDENGDRARTLLLKASCVTVDDGASPDLMLDSVVLSCSGVVSGDVTLSPDKASAGSCVAGDLASCAAVSSSGGLDVNDVLFQYQVMSGEEAGAGRLYANQLLGTRDGISDCTLRTRFVAEDKANANDGVSDGAIAAGVLYPVIEVDVDLGTCSNEAIDFRDPSAPVHMDYLFDSSQDTVFPFHMVDGDVSAY